MRSRSRLVAGVVGVLTGVLVIGGCGGGPSDQADREKADAKAAAKKPSLSVLPSEAPDTDPERAKKPRTPPPTSFGTRRVKVDSSARARLVGLDVGRGSGVETVTFEFAGTDEVPAYDVRYVDSVRAHPEDDPIALAGDAFLDVGFTFTDPNDQGRLKVPSDLRPGQRVVKETLLVKNLGGTLRFAVGLGDRVKFRAREASNPTRLIVEVQTS